MDKALQVQLQIRQNAEEVSSALHDIGIWEKTIKKKDRTVAKSSKSTPSASLRAGGTVPLRSAPPAPVRSARAEDVPSAAALTPASIVPPTAGEAVPHTEAVPKALGKYEHRDAEEVERERGNQEFKQGNFAAAVKAYTKCLGLKSQNYIAFSNRAMAYLKMKEYNRAVMDCNSALKIEPTHVKSLLRRANAYNALGKHRAALSDLLKASELEPANKQVRVDIQQTKELLRNAVNRAPLISSTPVDINEFLLEESDSQKEKSVSRAEEQALQGPDLPQDGPIKYEEPAVREGFERIQIVDTDNEEDHPKVVQDSTKDRKEGSISKEINTEETKRATTVAVEEKVILPIEEPSTEQALVLEEKQTVFIPITIDEGEDGEEIAESQGEKEEEIVSKETPSAESAVSRDEPITNKAPKAKETAKGKAKMAENKKSTSSKKSSDTAVIGAYELEKTLLQLQGDEKLLGKFVTGLKRSTLCSSLAKSQQLEPTVIFLLLRAVSAIIGRKQGKWNKVIDWFQSIAKLPSFSLLYQLTPREEQQELQQLLTEAVENGLSKAEESEKKDMLAQKTFLWKAFGVK